MSSSSNTKKRKGGAVCVGGDGGTVAAGLNDTIAEMKVHMTRIQNEMETRIVSMQNEMDSRATATKSLQNEVDGMKSRCQSFDFVGSVVAVLVLHDSNSSKQVVLLAF